MLHRFICAVVIGLIAGRLAGRGIKCRDYCVPMDTMLGIPGGVIGRFVLL